MPRSETANRLILLGGSILVLFFLLAAAELFIRIFMPHVQLLGTDRTLLVDPAIGRTYGWRPGATGTSFSAPVRINSDGFRDLAGPLEADSSILLFGDSVTFGVGVEADSSFAGMLQRAFPTTKIVNTAAIGYSLEDYHEIFLHAMRKAKNVKHAFIFYALNDFTPSLSQKDETPPFWAVRGVFREHSKLYIWLKGTFFDRSEDYFRYDYEFYTRESPALARTFGLLASLVDSLRSRDIPYTVVLFPYEFQLRSTDPQLLLPQQRLAGFLSSKNIRYVDTEPAFRHDGQDSRVYFLYADHMHLSPRGHAVVFNELNRVLRHPATR